MFNLRFSSNSSSCQLTSYQERDVRVRNKLLLDRWEALRRKSMSREGRVHTKLMQKQREEMQNLRDWMTEMEDRISQVFPSLAQLFQFASLLKKIIDLPVFI